MSVEIKATTIENCLIIAQGIAPIRTGNLVFNAMKIRRVVEGWAIVYETAFADYLEYLEDGTKRSQKHEGFISITTTDAIAAYLANQLGAETQLGINHSRDKIIKMAQDSPGRQATLLKSVERSLQNVE